MRLSKRIPVGKLPLDGEVVRNSLEGKYVGNPLGSRFNIEASAVFAHQLFYLCASCTVVTVMVQLCAETIGLQ